MEMVISNIIFKKTSAWQWGHMAESEERKREHIQVLIRVTVVGISERSP